MVKLKTISLTVKFSPQTRKINYTHDLPSNSVLQTENLERERERERERSITESHHLWPPKPEFFSLFPSVFHLSSSSIYNLPSTLTIATTSRLNHWSFCPKPQVWHHFSQSCHYCYPSLSLKLSLSTSLTTSVLSKEGQFFFFLVLIFVSFCVYILRFFIIIFVWILGKCEKPDKSVFSIAFSRIQPNIIKYFPKHFLEYNQTF